MFAKLQPAFPARPAPKSFSVISFADSHPINPVGSILYKNMGEGWPRDSHRSPLSSIFRTFFQVPYPVSPVVATLMRTAGVCTNNSHSGTLLPPLASPILQRLRWRRQSLLPLCARRLPQSGRGVLCVLCVNSSFSLDFQLGSRLTFRARVTDHASSRRPSICLSRQEC